MRSGPSIENRVIDILKTSDTLTLLQTDGEWVKVRSQVDENPKTGWLLSRFVTRNVPSKLLLTMAKKKINTLETKISYLEKTNFKMRTQLIKYRKDLSRFTQENTNLTKKFNDLKKGSQNYLKILEQLNTQESQLNQMKLINVKLNDAKNFQKIMWFLSGAGILLFGIGIGLYLRRNKNRSKYVFN